MSLYHAHTNSKAYMQSTRITIITAIGLNLLIGTTTTTGSNPSSLFMMVMNEPKAPKRLHKQCVFFKDVFGPTYKCQINQALTF